ncbi:MAG: hypothetical protein ABSH47_14990 [Bryobacteraceae bacterium]|jgi:hypothetical protein
MAYELFHNKAAKFSSPHLTIQGGRILFNAGAGDIVARVGMKFVHLLWDGTACKVAIRPITKEDGNTFKVSIRRGKRGCTISAQSFLNHIQWRASQPVTVDVRWNEAERLLEASLPREHVGTAETRRDTGRVNERRPGRKSTSP